MLVLANGAVIPHTNPGVVADRQTVRDFSHYAFFHGVYNLDDIINWCWGAGLSAMECLMVASANGYAFCVVEPRRRVIWSSLEAGWDAHCIENADLSYADKKYIDFNK